MFKGLKALLAGILAGTALGILFAPKEGRSIRKSFRDEIDSGGTGLSTLKDTFTDMGKDLHSSGKHAYSKLEQNENFQDMKETAKEHYERAKKEAKEHIEKAKKEAKKHVEKAKKKVTKTVKKKK